MQNPVLRDRPATAHQVQQAALAGALALGSVHGVHPPEQSGQPHPIASSGGTAAGWCARAARPGNPRQATRAPCGRGAAFGVGHDGNARQQFDRGSDAAAQAHFAIDKIEGALQSLGATLGDVVRTRVFVKNLADWEAVARAHGARFGSILPPNTLVSAPLVGDEYLVQIEADAKVPAGEGERIGGYPPPGRSGC